jgi:hypothetical protein
LVVVVDSVMVLRPVAVVVVEEEPQVREVLVSRQQVVWVVILPELQGQPQQQGRSQLVVQVVVAQFKPQLTVRPQNMVVEARVVEPEPLQHLPAEAVVLYMVGVEVD